MSRAVSKHLVKIHKEFVNALSINPYLDSFIFFPQFPVRVQSYDFYTKICFHHLLLCPMTSWQIITIRNGNDNSNSTFETPFVCKHIYTFCKCQGIYLIMILIPENFVFSLKTQTAQGPLFGLSWLHNASKVSVYCEVNWDFQDIFMYTKYVLT